MPALAIAILAAVALAIAPLGARAASDSPSPLDTEAQVTELCAALARQSAAKADDSAADKRTAAGAEETIARSYRVEIPAKGFAFGHYRSEEEEIELDGDFPLRAADGALSLDLEAIDDVAFAASADQVAAWTKAKKAGQLRLAVVFRPTGERCAGNPQARTFRLGGVASSWQILGEGSVLAAADEQGVPLAVEGKAAASSEAKPRSAKVESMSFDEAEEEGSARLEGVQAPLDRCAASAQRRGSMVVVFSVQGGHVRDPQVIVDGVRDETTSRCIAKALSGAALSGVPGGSSRGTATVALE